MRFLGVILFILYNFLVVWMDNFLIFANNTPTIPSNYPDFL